MNYTDRLIKIERIEPNPLRDFSIYPIHKDKIAKLGKSYAEGDFGTIIPVRMHPTKDGYYQQACGHHRVDTMKSEGKPLEILCRVQPLSDEQMASIMVRENMNNYGNNPEAVADSVASVAKVLMSWMFMSSDYKDFVGILTKSKGIFEDERAYVSAKGRLVTNNVIGRVAIENFFGAHGDDCPLSETQIAGALSSLTATGKMAEIAKTALIKAERQLAADKRAEKEQAADADAKAAEAADAIAKWEAAEIVRKAKRKEDLAAQKAMKESVAKAKEEARLAQELVDAAREKKRVIALEAERVKYAAKADKARKDAEKTAVAQAKTAKAKLNAADKKQEPWLHVEAYGMFDNQGQFDTFRNTLSISVMQDGATTYPFRTLFPVAQQPIFIKTMLHSLRSSDQMTGRGIKEYMLEQEKSYKAQVETAKRKAQRDNAAAGIKFSRSQKAYKIAEDLVKAYRTLAGVYSSLEEASKNDAELFDQTMGNLSIMKHDLVQNLDALERRSRHLRKSMGLPAPILVDKPMAYPPGKEPNLRNTTEKVIGES
jgi:hypothetical protein